MNVFNVQKMILSENTFYYLPLILNNLFELCIILNKIINSDDFNEITNSIYLNILIYYNLWRDLIN